MIRCTDWLFRPRSRQVHNSPALCIACRDSDYSFWYFFDGLCAIAFRDLRPNVSARTLYCWLRMEALARLMPIAAMAIFCHYSGRAAGRRLLSAHDF